MPNVQHYTFKGGHLHEVRYALGSAARTFLVSNASSVSVYLKALGQIYFNNYGSPHQVATPTSATTVDATTVASGLSLLMTEGTNGTLTTASAGNVGRGYIRWDWSITLSHDDASPRLVTVYLSDGTRTTQYATLAQNIKHTFSGSFWLQYTNGVAHSIKVLVPAGNIDVYQMHISASQAIV